ncbi:FHA domain-containing protein [Amycolatopsis sp. FBCC-B4732]|uniref:FHA domain-containing protein n=1 Tax=Amycolatopsis sp. FBCC-B4732 TaxID=3079339 RepID=UPI001FF19BC3|nr:FHA domain-containing protein [Amycolatopsis sp. FBCC-B4732]UOX93242.1 FHA domain-containing protein [Amycolatopsis sp. FBCC-B4732]
MRRDGRGTWVADAGSRNGTWVNGRRLAPRQDHLRRGGRCAADADVGAVVLRRGFPSGTSRPGRSPTPGATSTPATTTGSTTTTSSPRPKAKRSPCWPPGRAPAGW